MLKGSTACFGIVLILFLVGTAHGQTSSSTITVATNQQTYSDGDQMTISGTVSSQLNVPISIIVKDPSGNIVLIGQVSPNQNNTYSTTVTAGGDLWTAAGTYTIYVTYGSKDDTASATFAYAGTMMTSPITIQGAIYNATYEIANGKVLGIIPTTTTKSLTVRIQPSGDGMLTINLPRSLIDAKTNGMDSNYLVEEDGVSIPFNQTSSDTNSRTLAIPFNSTSSQITIMGTQMVPEFETIAILILGVSMALPILYFRTRLLPSPW